MKLIWEVAIPLELNVERRVTVNNHHLWVRLGPMDVPQDVDVIRENKHIVIELHYAFPRQEEMRTMERDDVVRVSFGKDSGRVYFVECDQALDIDAVRDSLRQLQSLVAGTDGAGRPQRRVAHYQLIADDVLPYVVQEVRHELMRESR